jgi:lipopolysaccharide export LptBFGC system permease protein LptF
VALGLVVAFFILTQLVSKMGMGARIPPVLAAWFPNLLFGCIGGVLLWRSR